MEMRYFFWSSSFLILGICVIRRLCSRGTSMKHRYTLWLMAVVTLCLLPFSSKMPPSMFSILNVANVLEGWMAGDGRDLEDLETGDQEHGKQTEAWGGKEAADGLTALEEKSSQKAWGTEEAAARDKEIRTSLLWGVWAMGAMTVGGWMFLVNRRLKRKLLAERVALKEKSRLPLGWKWLTLPVYLVKELASPCLISVKGEKGIYLPEHLLEEPEILRHTLAHEICHDRQWDLLWNKVRCVLLALYWFQPLVWMGGWLSRQDCELSCDEGAIKLLGIEERFAYGRTLLSFVGKAPGAGGIVCTGTWMTAGARQLRERVNWIARGTKLNGWAVLGYAMLLNLVFTGAFTRPMENPGSWRDTLRKEATRKSLEVQDLRPLGSGADSAENGEIEAELAFYLTEHHLLYVGDAVGSGRIVGACTKAIGLVPENSCSTELQTSQEPYVYRMIFQDTDRELLNLENIRAVSILAFASIDNLGALEVYVGPDGYEKGEQLLSVSRQEAMELYGLTDLEFYGMSEENMGELVGMVEEQLL
ncbi:MAG: DUF4825 domain-containing protein [Lachnospiraceae bacterium]|nr:DUF4825 domain-containing protein [Lachnospiraceae bacterium]MCI9132605.1 DUF4825 domain-containing protein [Lachnospiraceae bacterium]